MVDVFIISIERVFAIKISKRINQFDVMDTPCRGVYNLVGNFTSAL